MKLKGIRGKNQFGYSYVQDPKLRKKTDIVAIHHESQIVYTILRVSDKIPPNTIIIDYRLFDELGCEENTELEIKSISEEIPQAEDIDLTLTSNTGLDTKKVAETVSKRIEDLKPHLDGLIVREGQIIQLPDLKIELIVTHFEPSADLDRIARISWEITPKISITPMKSSQLQNQEEEISDTEHDTPSMSDSESVELMKKIANIRLRLDEFHISDLLIRLENIESQLMSFLDTEHQTESQVIESQSHEQLKEVITRLEKIAARLEELDNRIEQISTNNLE